MNSPRIPILGTVADFHAFADAGRKLADLHVGHESVTPHKLQRIENPEAPVNWRVESMKLSRDEKAIVYNDWLTLAGIPPDHGERGNDETHPRPPGPCPAMNRPAAACAPTFALLREKRRLAVRNPENGVRFTISLRDWQEMLWAVRVQPGRGQPSSRNPYTSAHRIMARGRIEDWLSELRLT